jgi:hypothetical protein
MRDAVEFADSLIMARPSPSAELAFAESCMDARNSCISCNIHQISHSRSMVWQIRGSHVIGYGKSLA